jgi:hypothetical protein
MLSLCRSRCSLSIVLRPEELIFSAASGEGVVVVEPMCTMRRLTGGTSLCTVFFVVRG